MQATALADFSSVFSKRVSRFETDLSNSTLIGVIEAHQRHIRKKRPGYTSDSVVYNLRKIQDVYRTTLYPDDVTDEFYACFMQHLSSLGLKYSSINTYCCKIKSALNWGIRHNCRVSSTYDVYDIPKVEAMKVSLTRDEISHIAHFNVYDISGKRPQHLKNLEKVRDMFVIQTNLFQRYSDTVKICPENFKNGVFTCIQQKTGNKARVDIKTQSATPELCFRLLEKYGYHAPYTADISNYNKYLHELICYIGGEFNDELMQESRVNGEIVQTRIRKGDLIASHCARRTAITLAVEVSPTETAVRRASGHKSQHDSFQRYIIERD